MLVRLVFSASPAAPAHVRSCQRLRSGQRLTGHSSVVVACAGESASPVYKLARLSLRHDEADEPEDSLDTIGDSPRSDVSSTAPNFTAVEGVTPADLMAPRSVPTVISWRHPGLSVYLTGDFNNWGMDHPMARDGNEFWSVVDLLPGTYHYKVGAVANCKTAAVLTHVAMTCAVRSRWAVDVCPGPHDSKRCARQHVKLRAS